MLIIVILAALLLVGIVLLIIYKVTNEWHDNLWILGMLLSAAFGLSVLVCGIVCIVANTPTMSAQSYVGITAKIDKLKDKQSVIYQTLAGEMNLPVKEERGEYHVVIDKPLDMANSINEYNCEVINLKSDLYMNKVMSDDLWINWFVNQGFKEVEGYNDSATDYKDILGDTLKTFELVKGE